MKLALVGIANRGLQNAVAIDETGLAEVTCLCDVNMGDPQTEEVISMFPGAKRFRDMREMYATAAADFDAVVLSIPDHTHFTSVMMALNEGKHVYVEKPMCRTFLEGELMIEAARKHPELVTQVGNQGHSEANYFQFKAWKEAGIIKDVTAIHAHMNDSRRWHKWDSNIQKPPQAEPMPKDMDWDSWLGPCRWHDYCGEYDQGNWRSWYDFGMGALGDWAAHIIDTAHELLELGLPYEITMLRADGHNDYFFPYASTILFRFPARGSMPPVELTWFDGMDNLPPLPDGYWSVRGDDAVIPSSNQGDATGSKLRPGKIIYAKDVIFKGSSHGSTLVMLPSERATELQSQLPEVPLSTSNHYENFLLACQGLEKTRSPFEITGVLCQVFCLGVIAQRLNTQLFFDPFKKRFTNNEFANSLLVGEPPRKGWEQYYRL